MLAAASACIEHVVSITVPSSLSLPLIPRFRHHPYLTPLGSLRVVGPHACDACDACMLVQESSRPSTVTQTPAELSQTLGEADDLPVRPSAGSNAWVHMHAYMHVCIHVYMHADPWRGSLPVILKLGI